MNNVLEFRFNTPSYRDAQQHKLDALPKDTIVELLQDERRQRDAAREDAERRLQTHENANTKVEHAACELVDAILIGDPTNVDHLKALAADLGDALAEWDPDT